MSNQKNVPAISNRHIHRSLLIVLIAVTILTLTGCFAGYTDYIPIAAGKNFDPDRMGEYEVITIHDPKGKAGGDGSGWGEIGITIPFWKSKKRAVGPLEQTVNATLRHIPGGVALVDARYKTSAFCLPVFVRSGIFSIRATEALVDPMMLETKSEDNQD